MKARDLKIGMSIHPPQFGMPEVIEDIARVIDVDGYNERGTSVVLVKVGCGQTLFFRAHEDVPALNSSGRPVVASGIEAGHATD